MWILQFLKYAFNASFEYFLQKVKGRFAAFAIQLVLSYIAIAVFTFVVTLVAIPLLNQGEISFEVLSTEGIFQWMGMLDPIWIVTSVVCVNYLFRGNLEQPRMSFVDLYKGKSSGFWLDLSIAAGILAVIFIIFNHSVLFYSYSDNTPLELLLSEGFENTAYSLKAVLSNWIFYLVHSVPVVALIAIEVRERKRNGIGLKMNVFKVILIAVLMSCIVSWVFTNFLEIFRELILNLLNVPFEMVEVPVFLGIIAVIFFKTFELMFISVFVHFLIAYAQEGSQPILRRNETNDLLDN